MNRLDLEQSFMLRRELRCREKELLQIKSRSLVHSPSFGSVHSSAISDKVAARAFNVVDLEASINQVRNTLNEVRTFIRNVPDPKLRSVLENKWWNNLSWEQTGAIVGASPEAVRKRYSRFAKKTFPPIGEQITRC